MTSFLKETLFLPGLGSFSPLPDLTGFCAYMTTAYETTTTATTVFQWIGIRSRTKLRMAVKTSSRADAKAFRMELRFLRKSDVTMPTIELLMMMAITKTWRRG